MEPPGRRSPWRRALVGGRLVAGPAVVAASAARAGAARAGPPRHVLPLPHRRPQGLLPDEPGGVVQAVAAAVPRHRAPRGTVPLQQHPGARQDEHVLVRSDPQGHHRRPRPRQGRAVQQVRALREAQLQGAVQADVRRPSESGRREMGQAQEDPQPRIPSGEAQGTPNDFLLFDICLTITNWRFLLKPPMKPPMVLGRCSTKREILEFL